MARDSPTDVNIVLAGMGGLARQLTGTASAP